MNPNGEKDLVLAGPMGAGKTSTGRTLATWLDREFADLDELVTAAEGCSVPELFARSEEAFRQAETRAVENWLSGGPGARVLSLGGGTLQNSELAARLARCATVVHLDAPAEQLAERLVPAEVGSRPLLADASDTVARLEQLRRERADGYAHADTRVNTAGKSVEGAAVAVLRDLYDTMTGAWRVGNCPVADSGVHEVSMGRGGGRVSSCKQAVLLWDTRLNADHADPLREQFARCANKLVPLEVVGGEQAKGVAMLVDAWRSLLAASIDRDAELWAVGGGTVTDLAGLLAHTYKRGLPLRLFPTTLVGQLDAALGGKNGINLDRTKNAVGTVRMPESVHLDPLFLLTLDEMAWRGGLCEAIKTALLGDASLLDVIERDADALAARALPAVERTVARCAEIKLYVVSQDAEDHGPRFALNLGHTLGHALEGITAKTDEPLSHGDAVAIGMIFATQLSDRLGVLEDRQLGQRIEAICSRFGLPTRAQGLAPGSLDALIERFSNDKKRRGNKNVWVLPVRAGEVAMQPVDEDVVHALLGEFL